MMREVHFSKQKKQPSQAAVQGQVLIVDDSAADIVGPFHLLHQLGYDVQVCFDGRDAIEKIKSTKFDLILLDLNMPETTGYNVLEALESVQSSATHRVVFYTSSEIDMKLCRKYQKSDVIDVWQKPMSASQLAMKIRNIG